MYISLIGHWLVIKTFKHTLEVEPIQGPLTCQADDVLHPHFQPGVRDIFTTRVVERKCVIVGLNGHGQPKSTRNNF